MANTKSYYEILEVRDDASQEVIKVAYKALCLKYHPDTTKIDKNESYSRMQKVNEAYEVLSKPDKRAAYNQDLFYTYGRNQNSWADAATRETASAEARRRQDEATRAEARRRQDEAKRRQEESARTEVERKHRAKWWKTIALVVVGFVIIATPLIVFNLPTVIEPGVAVDDYLNGETKYHFKNSIDEFINQQGSQFGDLETTVATYYAEMEYEDDNRGEILILNRTEDLREAIIEYELTLAASESDLLKSRFLRRDNTGDWLGFGSWLDFVDFSEAVENPAEKLITDGGLCEEVFASWFQVSVEDYLNLAVKNPTGKERSVIENSFKKFCTFAAADIDGNSQSQYHIMSNELINELNAIAGKYGGNCNFDVDTGEFLRSYLHYSNSTSQSFNATPNNSAESSYLEILLNPTIVLVVTTFDEEGATSTETVKEPFQVTFIQNEYGEIYLGAGSWN